MRTRTLLLLLLIPMMSLAQDDLATVAQKLPDLTKEEWAAIAQYSAQRSEPPITLEKAGDVTAIKYSLMAPGTWGWKTWGLGGILAAIAADYAVQELEGGSSGSDRTPEPREPAAPTITGGTVIIIDAGGNASVSLNGGGAE